MLQSLGVYVLLKDKSTWVAGDEIEVFYDPDTDAHEVKRNGTIETTGPYIGNYPDDFGFKSTSSIKYCSGTTLVTVRLDLDGVEYPYYTKGYSANNVSCQGDDSTCNIYFKLETTKVTPSVNSGYNGSIYVEAHSELGPVRYSISGQGVLPYNEAQVSPLFENLLGGKSYQIYAIDQYDCVAITTVHLPNEAGVFAERFRWSLTDKQGYTHRVRIFELGYTGVYATVKTWGQQPLRLLKENPSYNSIFDSVIKPTTLTIELASETEGYFSSMFTQNPRKIYALYDLNTGTGFAEQFRGYIVPAVYSEPYNTTPFPVKLTFYDGLKELERPITEEGEDKFYGHTTVSEVMNYIFKKTGHSLNINFGLNTFEDSHGTLDIQNTFSQTKIKGQAFYDDDRAMSCAEVLKEFCIPFACEVYQFEGAWWIDSIPERKYLRKVRKYNSSLAHISTDILNNRITLANQDINRLRHVERSVIKELIPAYGRVRLINKLSPTENFLRNGSFERIILNEHRKFERFDDWTYVDNGYYGSISPQHIEGNEQNIFLGFSMPDNPSGVEAYNQNIPYIVSGSKFVNWNSTDTLFFSLKVAVDKIGSQVPFAIVRMQIRVGNYYLNTQKKWVLDSTALYKTRATVRNDFATIEDEVKLPGGVGNTGLMQIKVYGWTLLHTDYGEIWESSNGSSDGLAELKAEPSTQWHKGDVVTVARKQLVASTWFEYINYYEWTESDAVNDDWNIIYPTDEAGNSGIWGGLGHWKLLKSVHFWAGGYGRQVLVNKWFYVDDVVLYIKPNGADTPEFEKLTLIIDPEIPNIFEQDIAFADMPEKRLSNDEQMFVDYFIDPLGSPTTTWNRLGITENHTIQKTLLKTYYSQYNGITVKYSGQFTTQNRNGAGGIVVKPYSLVQETRTGKDFIITRFERIIGLVPMYNLELVELKDIGSIVQEVGFNSDFNSDFGFDFDTTIE